MSACLISTPLDLLALQVDHMASSLYTSYRLPARSGRVGVIKLDGDPSLLSISELESPNWKVRTGKYLR